MSIRLQPVDFNTKGWEHTTKHTNDIESGDVDSNPKQGLGTPLSDLTEETLQGKGVFDVLMRAAKLHLKEEFDEGRITGKEYSTVYLGSVTAVLQTATQFLMNEQQAQQVASEIGLIRQKTVTELAQTCDFIPQGLGHNHIPEPAVTIDPIVYPGGTL